MRNHFVLIFSFIYLVFIHDSAFSQFNAEQLRVCTKEQQKQLFDSIAAQSLATKQDWQGVHHFTFIDVVPRGHTCTAVDSTKEIYIENMPLVSSEPPYNDTLPPMFRIQINADGYLSLAYTGFESKTGMIDLAKKSNLSSSSELEKYKKEFEFVADYLGVIPGLDVQKNMQAHNDSMSEAAKINLLRQKNILCEQSRIGKLIIKPLKNGDIVDYSPVLTSVEAREKRKTKDATDIAIVNGGMFEPEKVITITRMLTWNADSSATLEYSYNMSDKTCRYRYSYMNKAEDINQSFGLDAEGGVSTPESGQTFSNPEQAKFMQQLADRVIKYFE